MTTPLIVLAGLWLLGMIALGALFITVGCAVLAEERARRNRGGRR